MAMIVVPTKDEAGMMGGGSGHSNEDSNLFQAHEVSLILSEVESWRVQSGKWLILEQMPSSCCLLQL